MNRILGPSRVPRPKAAFKTGLFRQNLTFQTDMSDIPVRLHVTSTTPAPHREHGGLAAMKGPAGGPGIGPYSPGSSTPKASPFASSWTLVPRPCAQGLGETSGHGLTLAVTAPGLGLVPRRLVTVFVGRWTCGRCGRQRLTCTPGRSPRPQPALGLRVWAGNGADWADWATLILLATIAI